MANDVFEDTSLRVEKKLVSYAKVKVKKVAGSYVAVSVALREDDSFVLFITLIILTHWRLRTPLGTLRSNDATATGTSPEK